MPEETNINPIISQIKNSVINIESIIANPSVPKIYANTFTCSHSFTDASIVLQQGGLPVGLIQISFNSLKTLAVQLDAVVKNIEKMADQKIIDNNQMATLFIKKNPVNQP